ncbi:MAG: hypothetical protein GQ467_01695, partial [Mariprofundaceae bacterium]|nr:hypothetical protein [Mariprofundaceae bacterium]
MQFIKIVFVGLFVLVGAVAVYFAVSDEDYETTQSDTVEQGKSAFEDGRYDEAFHWFGNSARSGYAEAQHRFGLMYQQGKGVDRDDAQAVR